MEENIELKNFTTFKIGGRARYFCRARSKEELEEAVDFVKKKAARFFILGGGSNMLLSDGGFDGLVIKIEILGIKLESVGNEEVLAVVGAGESWDHFVAETVEQKLFGLENLSGIPGTVGGAPVQNIGAYGAEAKDSIVSVEALDAASGVFKVFSNAECRFAYRDSFFKTPEGKRYIITSVSFRLRKNGTPGIEYKDMKSRIYNSQFLISNESGERKALKFLLPKDVRQAVLEIRRGKFPDLKTTGTAGSFFKNPIIPKAQFNELKKKFPNIPGFKAGSSVKVSLAWILDNILGVKGAARGAVGLYGAQPLVVVNIGGATAEEVLELTRDVAARVKSATGISIEPEVEFLA